MSEDEMMASIRAGQAEAWIAVYDLCLSLGMDTKSEEPETGIECVERFIRENSSIATAALAWNAAVSMADRFFHSDGEDPPDWDQLMSMHHTAVESTSRALRLACDRYVEAKEK